jgi:hypothetical protein
MICPNSIRVQGRTLLPHHVAELQALVSQHPGWSRHRLAKEICHQWQWHTPFGQPKTFAARSLLLKLEQRALLTLPPIREAFRRRPWGLRPSPGVVSSPGSLIRESLRSLQPLQWQLCLRGTPVWDHALGLLRQHHYLGCGRPVGAHLLYLVADASQRDLAVHLVGAAAWQCAARDRAVGWTPTERARHLPRVANHARFLILPWVRTPHLASHLLGQLAGHLRRDWPARHGWRLELLETFVEQGRFSGAAYKAANWRQAGQTTGRTRQEKLHRAQAPVKAVWIYPLHPQFRQRLAGGPEEAR